MHKAYSFLYGNNYADYNANLSPISEHITGNGLDDAILSFAALYLLKYWLLLHKSGFLYLIIPGIRSTLYKRLNYITNSLRAYYLGKSLHTSLIFRTFNNKLIKK